MGARGGTAAVDISAANGKYRYVGVEAPPFAALFPGATSTSMPK